MALRKFEVEVETKYNIGDIVLLNMVGYPRIGVITDIIFDACEGSYKVQYDVIYQADLEANHLMYKDLEDGRFVEADIKYAIRGGVLKQLIFKQNDVLAAKNILNRYNIFERIIEDYNKKNYNNEGIVETKYHIGDIVRFNKCTDFTCFSDCGYIVDIIHYAKDDKKSVYIIAKFSKTMNIPTGYFLYYLTPILEDNIIGVIDTDTNNEKIDKDTIIDEYNKCMNRKNTYNTNTFTAYMNELDKLQRGDK